jgi:hypothetical protein
MKKGKQKRRNRFRFNVVQPPSRSQGPDLEQDALVVYLREAEQLVLPLIEQYQLGPAAAQLLLAQYAQVLATGDPRITVESGMSIGNMVLALWQEGLYTPGPQYPFTLEETVQELKEGVVAKEDYVEFFQPYTVQAGEEPVGLGEITGGIAKHPETQLWQIWLIVDGPCALFGAYRDPVLAQKGLSELIAATRRGASHQEGLALYRKLAGRGDGEPKQFPFDMMKYLVTHLERYLIVL